MQNRRRINLGQLWALKAVSVTTRDALGASSGHQNDAPGPILGRPGRAKSIRGPCKSDLAPVPRRSRDAPGRVPSAFETPSTIEHTRRLIYRRFGFVARKLRYAFRISFYSVLLGSNELDTKRTRATKTVKNPSVSASKIEPRSVRTTQNRAPAAKYERQNAEKSREAHRFFGK